MPATIALDARDAFTPAPRGWGRHVRELARALVALGAPVRVLARGWPGPELVWEQAGLPLAALARRDAVLHAPNCFLPLVRSCPGVVTVHDLAFQAFPEGFAPRTRWKYRVLARAAARPGAPGSCVPAGAARAGPARRGPARAQLLSAAGALVPGRRDRARSRLRGLPGGLRAAHPLEVPGAGAGGGPLGRAGDLRLGGDGRRRRGALEGPERAAARGAQRAGAAAGRRAGPGR